MPYYTGSASSFNDVLSAIQTACTTHGWTLSSGVLSKGAAHVKLSLATMTNTNGIVAQGGTASAAGVLSNPSQVQPRLGRIHTGSTVMPSEAWPAQYHIHIHDEPDEVFVILNFNVEYFYYLAWGLASVPGLGGSGLWLTGSVAGAASYESQAGFNARISDGEVTAYGACAPAFWNTYTQGLVLETDTVHTGPGWAVAYANNSGTPPLVGAIALTPLMGLQPNAWNGESVLLPIKAYQNIGSGMLCQVLDMRHARHIRMLNNVPMDVVALGHERWKIYPYVRKSTAESTASNLSHSNSLGWAIRYDGT